MPEQTDSPPKSLKKASSATKVEEAVLEMLEAQGVLTGINLNEVAKAAGVNRTLVYHHFGSRRGLLRSAIKHELRSRHIETKTPQQPMKLGARVVHGLRSLLAGGNSLKLTTLLHLDGSSAPKLMPNAETTLLQLERDKALGLVHGTDDLEALHATYAASVYGYALFREVFARDLKVDPEELDSRVLAVMERLFDQDLKEPIKETE